MTLEKIAKLAGVSLGTVSKAFSNSKEISQKTRQKIFDIAKEQGCYKKYIKTEFNKKVVALILPEVKSAYYADISVYFEEVLKKKGFLTVLATGNFNQETEHDLIDYFNAKKNCDGIIIINPYGVIPKDVNVPIIAIGSIEKQPNADCISIDFLGGITTAIAHLKENGHTLIGFLGETFTKIKEPIFKKAMNKNSLLVNEDYIFRSNKRFKEAGIDGLKYLLSLKTPPTAIITAYDYIAIGAIKYAKSIGLDIPKDLSIIGMDDISLASDVAVQLSSIKSNVKEVCDIAVDLLVKKMDSKFYTLRQEITIDCELQKRASVGKIN